MLSGLIQFSCSIKLSRAFGPKLRPDALQLVVRTDDRKGLEKYHGAIKALVAVFF